MAKDAKTGSAAGSLFSDPRLFYGLILISFILYFATGSWVFGLLIGILIVALVAQEFLQGASRHGIKNELKETALALAVALLVWFGAGFLLNTPSPLNAIVSCSMLPHLQRGDMVVLQGGPIQAPEVEVATIEGIENAQIYENGQLAMQTKGSLYAYCASRASEPLCARFISSPSQFTERHGELELSYGRCEIAYQSGARQSGPCVSSLKAGQATYYENTQNSIVVYQPRQGEIYSRVGDIIHRAFLILRSQEDGKSYVLTKGDNNPVFDLQVYDEQSGTGNLPPELSQYKGKVILQVPIVGYFKLFISPAAIATPEGCDRQYAKWG